jgi:hypothetical protein
MAAWNSMIYRLINIPMDQDAFDKELNLIKEIAIFNGYKKDMILRLVKKHKWKKQINELSSLKSEIDTVKKRSALIFIPKLSNPITKVFKKYNVEIVSSKNNNFKSLIGSTKDQLKENQKSGIYSIQCMDCDKCYVGQTRRNIGIRFKEHLRNIKNQEDEKSPLAEHVLGTNHNINSIKLLKQVNNSQELNVREAIEMTKNKNNLLNWDLNPLQNSLLKLLK